MLVMKRMQVNVLLALLLASLLVEKSCLGTPYVNFMGSNVANHSYFDLNQVGATDNGSNSLECKTDLETCCSEDPGYHQGHWYIPNGEKLGLQQTGVIIFEEQGNKTVYLHRVEQWVESGIYRCDIETNAVHTTNDSQDEVYESVYVGLYATGGNVTVQNEMTFTLNTDVDDEMLHFTLTTISIGGPATTVTWTTDTKRASGERVTVLNDPETAQYTHNLTMTGRQGGDYQCSVQNAKPSQALVNFTVKVATAPINVTAQRYGPYSIQIHWNTTATEVNTTSHRVYYGTGGNNSVVIAGSKINSQLLEGLSSGETYTVSVMATSTHLPSRRVNAEKIHMIPDNPNLEVSSATDTNMTVSWSVPGGVVDSYIVIWEKIASMGCPAGSVSSMTVTNDTTSYTITDLEEGSNYSIIVQAHNSVGHGDSERLHDTTLTTAPSMPPESVQFVDATFYTITIHWMLPDCIHRNGNITGFIVQYGVQDGGNTNKQPVSGAMSEMSTISGLTHTTVYSVQVAAVNHAGEGVFSPPLNVSTHQRISAAVSDVNATSITISWAVAHPYMPSVYSISYRNLNYTRCYEISTTHFGIPGSESRYTLEHMEEATEYSITVGIGDGKTYNDTIKATTLATAPSAAPNSVKVVPPVRASHVSLSWEAVYCTHSNGILMGYSVRYRREGSMYVHTLNVSTLSATITELQSLQAPAVSIEVAAVNNVGIGVYSKPLKVVLPEIDVHITLNEDMISNHGYVNVNDIGSEIPNALLCHTNYNGPNSGGNWYGPDETRVLDRFDRYEHHGFHRNRGPGVVRLLRGSTDTPLFGIYRCTIRDADLIEQSVFAGIYNDSNGDVHVAKAMMTVDSGLYGSVPLLTITCISEGGPATSIIWTRDSQEIFGQTVTIFNDTERAQYIHTLTQIGRLGGNYKCNISNNKPSSDSANLYVQVASSPSNLKTVQLGPNDIRVKWTPPSPLGDTVGYMIDYNGSQFNESVTDYDALRDRYDITGVAIGMSFNISLVALSDHFPSQVNTVYFIPLESPQNFVAMPKRNNVIFSWHPPRNASATVTGYRLSCSPSPSPTCFPRLFLEPGMHPVMGFDRDTTYSCSVVAYNNLNTGLPAFVVFEIKYELFQLHLSRLNNCMDVEMATEEIVEKLRSIYFEEGNAQCDCDIVIDNTSNPLVCSEKSITIFLIVSGRDSISFISFMDNWISAEPTISISGVLLAVNKYCSKSVHDFDSAMTVCTQPPTSDSENITPIIAGVVAVLMLLAAITLVIIILSIRLRGKKTTCGNAESEIKNKSKEELEMKYEKGAEGDSRSQVNEYKVTSVASSIGGTPEPLSHSISSDGYVPMTAPEVASYFNVNTNVSKDCEQDELVYDIIRT